MQSAGAPAAGYDAETALPIETFDDLARFADTPENTFARYVYDAENSGIPCKPGVTQTLEKGFAVKARAEQRAQVRAAAKPAPAKATSAKATRAGTKPARQARAS